MIETILCSIVLPRQQFAPGFFESFVQSQAIFAPEHPIASSQPLHFPALQTPRRSVSTPNPASLLLPSRHQLRALLYVRHLKLMVGRGHETALPKSDMYYVSLSLIASGSL